VAGLTACLGFAAPAAAQNPVSPDELSGIERPAQRDSEPVRHVTNALLWPFRLTLDLLFLTTGTAGGLLEDEQIVPRVHDFFFTRGDRLGVFPTFFVETGSSPNVGARFVANLEPFAATMRAGYGGTDENVAESRMRLSFKFPDPGVVSLEGLHDRRTGLAFSGLGQSPETDPRNQFRAAPGTGVFRERRERVIAGIGLRPWENVELLFSTSLTQRTLDDPADFVEGTRLTDVFLPASVVGANATIRISYSELALRLDTRKNRGVVELGALFEGYAGVGRGVFGSSTQFGRAGFQAAGFFPFLQPFTLISPKITVDSVAPDEHSELPFIEFVGQPTFRGFDNRRDNMSAVFSLDYEWYLMRFVAARLFGDVARVFPSLSELTLDQLRWVAGFGLDLNSSTSELGRIAFAFGPEGYNFLLTIGVSAHFGDRQHRE
jgi:hypothetical protein